MKIKTAELIGAALDWAVAKCEDGISIDGSGLPWVPDESPDENGLAVWFKPSTNWAQGGPIIEREIVDLRARNNTWFARAEIEVADGDWIVPHYVETYGATPLVAAMRCYVASKLGDEFDVPEELVL